MKLRARPNEYDTIQWNNNEPQIREFIQDENSVKFPNERCEIWDNKTQSWINVPMFSHISKSRTGRLGVLTAIEIERDYEQVE